MINLLTSDGQAIPLLMFIVLHIATPYRTLQQKLQLAHPPAVEHACTEVLRLLN